jgi:hypothetical protein
MSAELHFREAGPADRDGILRLRSIVFHEEDREKLAPEFWDWEFTSGPAGPGRAFVAEAGREIVGHFAVIPQRYEAGTPLSGALGVDAMTHPDFRRARVFRRLVAFASDRLKHEFQVAIAFQIRQQVLPGMVAGGWRPAATVPVLLRPLSWLGLARDFGLPVRERTGTRRTRPVPHVRPLTSADLEKLDPLVAVPNPRQPRTAAFVRWRYLSSPGRHYDLRGLFDMGELRAFVISRETVLRGMRTLAIADAGATDAATMKQLLGSVCGEAAVRGTSLAAALMSPVHPSYAFLRRSGFFLGPHRFRLLLQTFDDRLRDVTARGWSLTWGDTDHL